MGSCYPGYPFLSLTKSAHTASPPNTYSTCSIFLHEASEISSKGPGRNNQDLRVNRTGWVLILSRLLTTFLSIHPKWGYWTRWHISRDTELGDIWTLKGHIFLRAKCTRTPFYGGERIVTLEYWLKAIGLSSWLLVSIHDQVQAEFERADSPPEMKRGRRCPVLRICR